MQHVVDRHGPHTRRPVPATDEAAAQSLGRSHGSLSSEFSILARWFRIRDERPETSFETRWRGVVKRRLVVTLVVFASWVSVVEGRLVYLQVIAQDRKSV